MEIIQEEISFGRGDILKVVGSCVENFVRRKIVSSDVVRKCQRESMSANRLCFPRWCCEYSVELYSISMRAMCLEQCSCIGFVCGSKLDLNIQPTDEELSLHPRQHDSGARLPSRASIQIHTICAMNSSRLFVCVLLRDGGI